MSLHRNQLRGFIAGAVTAIVLLLGSPAVAEPPSLDDVYRELGIDAVGAEYVVVVDTSKSMLAGDLYGAVRDSLREFVAALAPEDGITVVSMADSASVVFGNKIGRTPDAAIGALPPVPTGNYTDIGAGISVAVDALEKHRATAVAGVILLTDGQHDPAPGSPFPLSEGHAWQQLSTRAAKLPQQISSYAVQLRGVSGANLLAKAFPGAQVLNSAAVDQLTTRLGEPKAAVRAGKARSVLGTDLDAGVTVEWPAGVSRVPNGTTTLPVTIRSRTRYLPLELRDLRVETTGAASVTVPGDPVAVAPGTTVTVPVTVTWDAGTLSWKPSDVVERPIPLTILATIGSPWEPTLARDLKLTIKPELAGASVTGRGYAQRGSSSWWLTSLVVLLGLFLIGWRLFWLRLHPVPGGMLVASSASDGAVSGSVPLQRRRTTISAANLGIPGSGSISGRRKSLRSDRYLAISYSSDGSQEKKTAMQCEPDGSVDIDDLQLRWSR